MNKTAKAVAAAAISLFILTIGALPALGEEVSGKTPEKAPENIAVVNGKAITQADFDRELSALRARFAQRGQRISDAHLATMKPQILDQLIGNELLYQEATKTGVAIPKDQVAQYMAELKQRFPSEEAFQKGLAGMQITEEGMRDDIEKNMMIQELIKGHLLKDVTASDAEAKAFYDARPELFKTPEQVKASHILIKVSKDAEAADKEAAMKTIKEIGEKANKGADFAELAKEYSQGPSATKGGDLGFFKRGQMVKPFEEAAFTLSPGNISDVVETQFGYHLIKVMEKKAPEVVPFDTAKEKIKKNISLQKGRQIVAQHVQELMKTAKIEKQLN